MKMNPMPFSAALLKRSLVLWGVLIGIGVLAYGFGLYQGSQHRSQQLQRSMASEPQR